MSPLDRLSCEELVRRLDSYLDHELNDQESRLVREHLEGCAKCAAEYAFETNMLEELRGKIRRIQAPAGLLDRITRRIVDAPARED